MNALRRFVLPSCVILVGIASLALVLAVARTGARSDSATRTSRTQAAHNSSREMSRLDRSTRKHVAENYGKLPLHFEANQGQSDSRVKFLSRGAGYTLFLTSNEAVFRLQHESSAQSRHDSTPSLSSASESDDTVLRMKLVAANPASLVAGLERLEGKSNYFLGSDSRQWYRNIPNFSQVRYQDAYPGIDLVYYGNQQQLEYDFVVAPGADPRTITLEVGSNKNSSRKRHAPLRIAANGDLLVPVENGDVSFHRPVVYQTDGSAPPHAVGGTPYLPAESGLLQGRWILKSPTQVSFEIAAYDHSKPLIVDPALGFSTYLGGLGSDVAQAIAVDSQGNAYITGNSNSPNFPGVNSLQTKMAGKTDAVVSKLDPTGSTLLYSTYLGGSQYDSAFGIAVDSSGNAYVSGDTGSSDFPVTPGAFQTTWAGGSSDVFLSKLDATGSQLVYSTFLGGSGTDRLVEGVAVDSLGNAFVTGWTTSPDFPTSSGAFQTTFTGTQDGFVTKFNPTGSALIYSTLLGGSATSFVNSVVLDASDNAFLVGQTTSSDFPATPGVVQNTLHGVNDMFVAKLNSAGSALLYSTYLGGTGRENGFGIALDSAGNVYVTGLSCSKNFPTTAGAFQRVYKGICAQDGTGGNAVVAELSPTLSSLLYSTFIGGSRNDVGYTIAIDSTGVAHIAGRTTSLDFPTTPGAFQTTFGGVSDAFLVYLNPTGSQLNYSTYLGGNSSDAGYVLALDPAGNDVFDGRTHSTNFPTTPGAFDPTCSKCTLQTSSSHIFVSRFVPGDQVWPLALNFGYVNVGTTTSPLVTTLANSETSPLNINSVSISGTNASNFIENDTCGSSLAPGASCSISVTLNPPTTGGYSGLLSISDSAANSPQTVVLSGNGTTASASLTPSTITFATQLIHTSSPSQAVTLTSTGSTALTISKIATTAQYSQTNNCTPSLAPTASCTINLTFSPNNTGTQQGSLTVNDDSVGNPQTVALTGNGTAMSSSTTSLNLGSEPIGTSSAPQSFTVTNIGSSTVSITSIGITGLQASNFSEINNCGTSLAAGANCTITVTFTPQVTGVLHANVSVSDTGGGSPQLIHLTGTGT